MPKGNPLGPEAKARIDKYIKEVQRENSSDFKEAEREQKEKEKRAEFITRAEKAGFTPAMAEFMYDNLSLAHHEHWDGRIGGG